MKKLVAVALLLALFVPTTAAQTAATFTGKWEGTFTRLQPDGTDGSVGNLVLDLTQKGSDLSGMGGPPDQQSKVEKGAVNAGKATFEIQAENGPLFKFTVTIVKGRLQGEMIAERNGAVLGKAKVDAAKAK